MTSPHRHEFFFDTLLFKVKLMYSVKFFLFTKKIYTIFENKIVDTLINRKNENKLMNEFLNNKIMKILRL